LRRAAGSSPRPRRFFPPGEDPPPTVAAPAGGPHPADPTIADRKGEAYYRQNSGEGGGYSHIMPPNSKACFWRGDDQTHTFETMVCASSYHPGGVNVLFLDGSVRYVKDSVNRAAWRAIATYAGGEIVSSDSF
jgi:prepilin-type processing-associated H-X9-DG protein